MGTRRYSNRKTPTITEDRVVIKFARSGGPGGQNVNKVSSKVDMRFNVRDATWLPDDIREKLMQNERNRINKDGDLIVSSTRFRNQRENIDDALQKIQAMIDEAAYIPPPPTQEDLKLLEKRKRVANANRLVEKKFASEKKKMRRSSSSDW
eukprot:jgi/Mesvir1/19094/Mv12845-RA.1